MTTSQRSEVGQQLRKAVLRRDAAGLTDGQLLDEFIERGDDAAFEMLVRRHGAMVLGVCRRIVRNNHDAEDAFQATFLVLVRKAGSVSPRERVGNWLYGVAYQTAVKARALAAKRRFRERQVTEMPEPEAAPPPDLWRELRPVLDQELSRLPDKYRTPIVLCDLEGKTGKEAARQLGCPEGTVTGRLSRARAMLAKRLTRRGLAFGSASLGVVLAMNVASASVPTPLLGSTIKAASLFAAGQAAATGAVSAEVAALTQGVIRAMWLTKLKLTVLVLSLVAFAGLGAGTLTHRAMAQRQADTPKAQERPAARAREARKPDPNAPVTLTGKVVGVSKDGKTITLETAPANGRTGAGAKRADVKITDKTEVVYRSVGLNGAKPTEGYNATVVLQKGSTDTAEKASFNMFDVTKRPSLSGKVVSVSQDGKQFTAEFPGRGEAIKKDFNLPEPAKVTYAYVAKDAAKPTVGYQVDVWSQGRGGEEIDKLRFVDSKREQDLIRVGRVVAVGKDGSSITLEIVAALRSEAPKKVEVKIAKATALTFSGVGPDGAKLTVGYHAKVWLQEAAKDTAATILLGTLGRGGRDGGERRDEKRPAARDEKEAAKERPGQRN